MTNESYDMCVLSHKYLELVCECLSISSEQCSKGELAAFVSYAIAFPSEFLALIDTYNVLRYECFC